MTINDIIALSRAGFTKEDIYALVDSTPGTTYTPGASPVNGPVSVPVSVPVHSPQPQPQTQPRTYAGSVGNTNSQYGAQNGTQGQPGSQNGAVNNWQYGAGQFQNLPAPGTTQNNPSAGYVPVDTSRAMDVPIGGYPQGSQFGAQGENGVISAIDDLKRAIQTQNVLTMSAQMPKTKTTEDVVANIINPPEHVLKPEHVEP